MIVTTGKFTDDAYRYSEHVMRSCNLNIILLDEYDLQLVSQDVTKITDILNRKARQAMKLKERSDLYRTQ